MGNIVKGSFDVEREDHLKGGADERVDHLFLGLYEYILWGSFLAKAGHGYCAELSSFETINQTLMHKIFKELGDALRRRDRLDSCWRYRFVRFGYEATGQLVCRVPASIEKL